MSAIQNIRGGLAFIRDIGRLRQIVAVLVRHGFGEVVERLNLGASVVGRLAGSRDEGGERMPVPRRTLLAIQDLGPTFVKLGQILSTRPDLIPPEFVTEFQQLQDQVTPLPATVVREEIERSLGKPVEALLQRFDDEPLASASIAQVHRAALADGAEVVVKVRRPGIAEVIAQDVDILKFLALRIEQSIPEARVVDLPGIVREFEKAILKEVDFRSEADHLDRFARNFAGVTFVHIPHCHRALSTDSVLVMEYVRGVKITAAAASGSIDRTQLVRRAVQALFMMAFEHGFFHGDMHPGNVLVEEDGTIAFVDCGLAGRLPPHARDRIVDLMLGIVRQDVDAVAEAFYEIGIKTAPVNFDQFVTDTSEVMDTYFVGRTLKDVQFGAFFGDLVDGAMRHQLRVPPEYTMLFKAIMTVEGIGKTIAPDVDIVAEARPFVERLVRERYSPETVTRQVLADARNLGRFLRQFPLSARQILLALEHGKVSVEVKAPDAALDLARARLGAANRLSVAIIAGALIIAGTLAAGATDGRLGPLSLVLYALAAAIGGVFWILFLRPPPKR
jgi:ubiquinone biosynthesis protein